MVSYEGEDVMFGNGYFAKIYDMFPSQKDKDVWICKIKPTETTRDAYELQVTDAERNRVTGAYTKEYRDEFIIERNRGKRGRSWFFLCGFNGEETNILEYIGSKHLRKIEFLRMENEELRIQRIQTHKEIKEAHKQPDLFREEMFEKMVRVNQAAAAATNAKPGEKRTEESYG